MGDNTTAAFVLALIGGILILLSGILVSATTFILGSFASAAAGAGLDVSAAGTTLLGIGVGSLILGIFVIVGSLMIRKPGKQKTWGIITLVLSLIALLLGGGFLLGSILGFIGGLLALINKQ